MGFGKNPFYISVFNQLWRPHLYASSVLKLQGPTKGKIESSWRSGVEDDDSDGISNGGGFQLLALTVI